VDFIALVSQLPSLEAASVLCSVLYLVLAIRESLWCWPAAFVASVLSVVVLFAARLYSESALNVFYAAMAVYGWYQWRYGGRGPSGKATALPIGTWAVETHAVALGAIAVVGALTGWVLHRYTAAAFPYTDSFVTVASVITTYMVARKILENWLYWFVIDSVSLYLYVVRELYLFAGLFVLYLVLIVIGWYRWRRDWLAQPQLAG
jgi:nicotinamide mononucleotide transporter